LAGLSLLSSAARAAANGGTVRLPYRESHVPLGVRLAGRRDESQQVVSRAEIGEGQIETVLGGCRGVELARLDRARGGDDDAAGRSRPAALLRD